MVNMEPFESQDQQVKSSLNLQKAQSANQHVHIVSPAYQLQKGSHHCSGASIANEIMTSRDDDQVVITYKENIKQTTESRRCSQPSSAMISRPLSQKEIQIPDHQMNQQPFESPKEGTIHLQRLSKHLQIVPEVGDVGEISENQLIELKNINMATDQSFKDVVVQTESENQGNQCQ